MPPCSDRDARQAGLLAPGLDVAHAAQGQESGLLLDNGVYRRVVVSSRVWSSSIGLFSGPDAARSLATDWTGVLC